MAHVTRKIGLSLGADLCWPAVYEELLKRLDLSVPVGGDQIHFETERVMIEPFDIRQHCSFTVVLDRLTHWYHTSREWIKKAVILDGLYVLNNPWSVQSMQKHTSYCAMVRLGLPIPETWLVPPKEYEDSPDLQPTLERYAKMFDLKQLGDSVGYPLYMKPYDGGGWVGVNRIENCEAFETSYEASGRHVMQLQRSVEPYDLFVRSIGIGPQTREVLYDPGAPLHDRYTQKIDFLSAEDQALLQDITLTVNSFFGWDFNSCESLRTIETGVWHPIDFANPCPDSQVTSLHYHFPWLVSAKLRWSLFCAAYKRQKPQNLNWAPYFEIADSDLPYREKLSAYAAIGRSVMEVEGFEEFCTTHLSHLGEVAYEFFESDQAKQIIRQKVESQFPSDEVEEFTELFWSRIQIWRAREGKPGERVEQEKR
jgi:hypothetical protein